MYGGEAAARELERLQLCAIAQQIHQNARLTERLQATARQTQMPQRRHTLSDRQRHERYRIETAD